MQIQAQLPVKFKPLFSPKRHKVFYGGRGGAKSWNFARALILLAISRQLRILCTREFQKSIKESVHKLLSDQINKLKLSGKFTITQTSITCNSNDSEFIFAGLKNNATQIKSMEGIDICWVEEADKVSNESWEILIPTIRKAGSEIWISFNPSEETDPTYKRFVINPPPDSIVVQVNWRDNPWFPEELRKEKDYLASVDMEAYEHIWEGKCRLHGDAQILRGKCFIEDFIPGEYWHGPYQGADWGFANDPTTLIRSWINDRILYIEHEIWKVGLDIDKTPVEFDKITDAVKYITYADNARPETISYMQRHGYPRIVPCEKWPGSIEDGIAFLKQFEKIIIHPRCGHTAEESRLWSYKVDKLTGDVLPEVIDKHNHCWDAIRYSLGKLIIRSANEEQVVLTTGTGGGDW